MGIRPATFFIAAHVLACQPTTAEGTPAGSAALHRIGGLRAPGDAPEFVGTDETGIGGAPLRRPDRIAIATLLRFRRFADLDRWLAHYQDEFEADPRKEEWALDAFDAFAIADPTLGEPLDAWVAASPGFAAHGARGAWRLALGLAARGTDWAGSADADGMAAMHRHFGEARVDLERTIELRPSTLAAHVHLMAIAKFAADPATVRAHMHAALAQCSGCYEPRAMYLTALEPRWGGSYESMAAFVAEVAPLVPEHPKLKLLAGFAAWDRCRLAGTDADDRALAACDEAVAQGEEPRFLVTRAEVHRKLEHDDAARADLDRAIELSPQHADARRRRSRVRRDGGDLLGAADDLVVALRVDPVEPALKESVAWMVEKLSYEGDSRAKAGKHAEAAPYLAAAAALAPEDGDVRQRRAWNAGKLGPAVFAPSVAASPDDFDLRLMLDHALAQSRRFAEVVTSWDAYLELRPTDARAYYERGGARWHAGQREDGIVDTQKACDLGIGEACDDLPKLKARLSQG